MIKGIIRIFYLVLFTGMTFSPWVQAQTILEKDALLVADFTRALEDFAKGMIAESSNEKVNIWIKGLRDRGVSSEYLAARLAKKENTFESDADRFAAYRRVLIEQFPVGVMEFSSVPVALHAFRLDVIEDYDDLMNDNLYCYFITTHDDVVWGKVTQIYRGLDEGDSVFLSPEDRGLFGPRGEKVIPKNHTIIDYGIVESDGDDIQQLQKISDAIVDLAVVALTVYHPQAGVAAAQAREETKNLLKLVIELDGDDRLVTDTIRFNPALMRTMLSGSSVHEFARSHERTTVLTRFSYRLNFRMLR